jgi:hypothetical protein
MAIVILVHCIIINYLNLTKQVIIVTFFLMAQFA